VYVGGCFGEAAAFFTVQFVPLNIKINLHDSRSQDLREVYACADFYIDRILK
jgi:hypothetical protein